MSTQINGTTGVNTSNLVISGAGYTTPQSLADGATIAWDWSIAQSALVTINGNRILSNPINAVTGQYAAIRVNRGGAYVLSFDTLYKGVSFITQTSISGAIDHLVFRYNGTNFELVSIKTNIGV